LKLLIIPISLLTLGCSTLTDPSPVNKTHAKVTTGTCTITLDQNVKGHENDLGEWVKANLVPSESGACGTGCGDVGCPVWSFDIPPSNYQVCQNHADTFAPCSSRNGKYLHILGGPGEYLVTATIAGVEASRIVIVEAN
jgi:hypothetical protein